MGFNRLLNVCCMHGVSLVSMLLSAGVGVAQAQHDRMSREQVDATLERIQNQIERVQTVFGDQYNVDVEVQAYEETSGPQTGYSYHLEWHGDDWARVRVESDGGETLVLRNRQYLATLRKIRNSPWMLETLEHATEESYAKASRDVLNSDRFRFQFHLLGGLALAIGNPSCVQSIEGVHIKESGGSEYDEVIVVFCQQWDDSWHSATFGGTSIRSRIKQGSDRVQTIEFNDPSTETAMRFEYGRPVSFCGNMFDSYVKMSTTTNQHRVVSEFSYSFNDPTQQSESDVSRLEHYGISSPNPNTEESHAWWMVGAAIVIPCIVGLGLLLQRSTKGGRH